MRLPTHIRPLLSIALAALAVACGDGSSSPDEPTTTPTTTPSVSTTTPLALVLVDTRMVQGGELQLNVTPQEVSGLAQVTLDGQLDGGAWSHTWEVTLASELPQVRLGWSSLMATGIGVGSTFEGDIEVVVAQGRGVVEGVTLEWLEGLTPSLSPLSETVAVHLGDATRIPAEGLLRPSEGGTSALLWGEFDEEGGVTRPVSTRLAIGVGTDRNEAVVVWPATALGLREGVCRCELIPRNDAVVGEPVLGEPVAMTVRLKRSVVDALEPSAFSRGQVVRVLGRGLVAPEPGVGQAIFFDLEGRLTTDDGGVVELLGERVFRIAPEQVVTSQEAWVVLRTETAELDDGRTVLTGLSALSGTFEGTVTPVLVLGTDTARGAAWEGQLRMLPTRQVVFVHVLPHFVGALGRFGLEAWEGAVRARMLEVLRRDYDGLHIVFQETRPTDMVEYSVIEVGGPDPNGVGLLGLDNTEGKDTGNVRLNDVVGGYNAETREQGFYSFGGVFVESILQFSPTLNPEHPLNDPAFDTIFGPFAPELGGQPARSDEMEGVRGQALSEAIRALGSIIGNTVGHEIGHSLGLTWFEEDVQGLPSTRFHNPTDQPGAIMDQGQDRPFAERAELEGAAEPHFTPGNRAYLEFILPMP